MLQKLKTKRFKLIKEELTTTVEANGGPELVSHVLQNIFCFQYKCIQAGKTWEEHNFNFLGELGEDVI